MRNAPPSAAGQLRNFAAWGILTAVSCGAIGCGTETASTGGASHSGNDDGASEQSALPAGALTADASIDAIHAALRSKNPGYQDDAQIQYVGNNVAQVV